MSGKVPLARVLPLPVGVALDEAVGDAVVLDGVAGGRAEGPRPAAVRRRQHVRHGRLVAGGVGAFAEDVGHVDEDVGEAAEPVAHELAQRLAAAQHQPEGSDRLPVLRKVGVDGGVRLGRGRGRGCP